MKILVVEDDDDLRLALLTFLEAEGFTVRGVSDGNEAEGLASRFTPDVVLCDIRMPGMGGIEVCRSLKRLDPAPKVVLMTAYPEWHEHGAGAGADRVLRKPFPLAFLAAMLREWNP